MWQGSNWVYINKGKCGCHMHRHASAALSSRIVERCCRGCEQRTGRRTQVTRSIFWDHCIARMCLCVHRRLSRLYDHCKSAAPYSTASLWMRIVSGSNSNHHGTPVPASWLWDGRCVDKTGKGTGQRLGQG